MSRIIDIFAAIIFLVLGVIVAAITFPIAFLIYLITGDPEQLEYHNFDDL